MNPKEKLARLKLDTARHELSLKKIQVGYLEDHVTRLMNEQVARRLLENRASVRQARYAKVPLPKKPRYQARLDDAVVRGMAMRMYEPSSAHFMIGNTGHKVILAYRIVEVYQSEHKDPKGLAKGPRALVDVACSFCSPKDHAEGKFDYLAGREDAIDRLDKCLSIQLNIRLCSLIIGNDLINLCVRKAARLNSSDREVLGIPRRVFKVFDRVAKGEVVTLEA